MNLPYSRFLESEADEVGLLLAAKACYDVRHVPLFWRRQSNEKRKDGIDPIHSLSSTHPSIYDNLFEKYGEKSKFLC